MGIGMPVEKNVTGPEGSGSPEVKPNKGLVVETKQAKSGRKTPVTPELIAELREAGFNDVADDLEGEVSSDSVTGRVTRPYETELDLPGVNVTETPGARSVSGPEARRIDATSPPSYDDMLKSAAADVMKPKSASRSETPTPKEDSPDEPEIKVPSSLKANAVISDTGGYKYQYMPDGSFKILASPKGGEGKIVTKNNKYYNDILKHAIRMSGGESGLDWEFESAKVQRRI
jgi:hypothetical protein